MSIKPDSSRFRFTADLTISRILNGMWQVSGAHGRIDAARAVEEMFAYHDAGFTTWDLADHYGPAEDFIGAFRRRFVAERGADRLSEIQTFTKWVPHPGRMTRRTVEEAIGVSLERMDVESLDLLQFHWWDYADKHGVGIANVGMRYVLDRPAVAGVIVGARLGVAQHIEDNARTFGFALDAEDLSRIEAVLARSRDLMTLIGDCGDEYRR